MREQIIRILNREQPFNNLFQQLKYSIGAQDDLLIDQWFEGVIKSLYYRPNHQALVLVSDDPNVGDFFNKLFPQEINYVGSGGSYCNIYETLLIHFDGGFEPGQLDFMARDGYIIRYPYTDNVTTDKRLASYCVSCDVWRKPERKSFIVCRAHSIDWDLYDSINKLHLWVEIFNKFKIISHETNTIIR